MLLGIGMISLGSITGSPPLNVRFANSVWLDLGLDDRDTRLRPAGVDAFAIKPPEN
jgi:hypothetical protein